MSTIMLAGVAYEIKPLSLGKLRIIIPAFGRVGQALARGEMSEVVLDDLAEILAAGIGIDKAAAEQIPAAMHELVAAMKTIADVSGLVPAKGAQGGAQPAVEEPTTGTTSTAG